ncbi:MAG: hypothetical protein IT472_02450 [Thermomonas sp.]|uniref:hypothetical protein n=1 Tax=Thermomonas sp. TaxID=1971895 RepID=UPI00263373BF|nr:hypothetical protein [Thermomonas sp.]MCC7096028.1 hypothetical protein [Thermomonas sp.]
MNNAPIRRLQFVDADQRQQRNLGYWRQRSTGERLHAVLTLHREGNALFKGGHPPFTLQWKLFDGQCE